MGLDDLVNKAKDLMGGAEAKAAEAQDAAQAGDQEKAAAASAESSSLMDKAKGMLTDERIDQVSEAIKSRTPENIDAHIDTVAGKAKEWNNPSNP